MGFLAKLFGTPAGKARVSPPDPAARLASPPTGDLGGVAVDAVLYGGHEDLEVVGESHYQDALWATVGPPRGREVRHPVTALLMPETDNSYDANAVAVYVTGGKAGYLSADTAGEMQPGVTALMEKEGRAVALSGVIVGGSSGRSLGLFLSYDPTDFGLAPTPLAERHQHLTDTGDTAIEYPWEVELPTEPVAAIACLRRHLAHATEPVERHFLYFELESHLYKSRETFDSALEEYDEACRQHDAEMETIRPALIGEFSGLPRLTLYKQSAIRHQKAHDFEQALWWAQRGLDVYGTDALRPENVADLSSRVDKYKAKLSQPEKVKRAPRPRSPTAPRTETLVCEQCGSPFERRVTSGRKPSRCPACREES